MTNMDCNFNIMTTLWIDKQFGNAWSLYFFILLLLFSNDVYHSFSFIEDRRRQAHLEVVEPVYLLIAKGSHCEGHKAVEVKYSDSSLGVESAEQAEEEGENKIVPHNCWQLEGEFAHDLVLFWFALFARTV